MGFTTGLLGGFTLTATILYLSVQLHTRNRVYQSALLAQQSLILNNIVEPQPALPPPTERIVRAGVWESVKDRWNTQLESNVRKLQDTDWDRVRGRMENGLWTVYGRAFEKSKEIAAATNVADSKK